MIKSKIIGKDKDGHETYLIVSYEKGTNTILDWAVTRDFTRVMELMREKQERIEGVKNEKKM